MGERNTSRRQEQLATEAVEWIMRSPPTEPAECEEFTRWLCKSPEHVKEFLVASDWHDVLVSDLGQWRIDADRLLSRPNVIHVPSRAAANVARTRFSRFRYRVRTFIALAASVAVIAFVLVNHFRPTNTYATSLGEQRTVSLSDGSIVAVNTQSRIRLAYSSEARDVYLDSGQAMFTVSHDATRPFRVHVEGSGIVQAIGTKFDVRRMPDRTSVSVIEGLVQITPIKKRTAHDSLAALSERSSRLAAGEGLSILDSGGLTPPTPIDASEVNAWQQRRLVFRNDTLRDIVAEFHRYSRARIRIEDKDLAEQRYSGVWDADSPDALLTYLKSHGSVLVDRDDDEFVLRRNQSPTTD